MNRECVCKSVCVAVLVLLATASLAYAQQSTVSVAPGPCTNNTAAPIPVWTGTGVSCISEAMWDSQPAGSWNVCLSGTGTYANGVWTCTGSPAYSEIYVTCWLQGLGVTIGCGAPEFSGSLLTAFGGPGSWIGAAVSIADLLINRKPGMQGLCDAASYGASFGKTLPYAISGLAIDQFCQFYDSTSDPPTSYTVTINGVTGNQTIVAVSTSVDGTSPGPTVTNVISYQAGNGVIPPGPGSQLLHVSGSAFFPGLTVSLIAPDGSRSSISAPKVQNVMPNEFIVAVDFQGYAGTWSLQVMDPDGSKSNTYNLTVGSSAGAFILAAAVRPQSTSVDLSPVPAGAYCMSGAVDGGAAALSPFATSQYASVLDADGITSAELAYGANASNSVSTSAAYVTVGEVCVGGSFDQFVPIFQGNSSSGASAVSVNFTTSETSSLVVIIALASSQKTVQLTGLPGLQIDASSAGVSGQEPMVIAHAVLGPGTYRVNETSSVADLVGQDPNHAADLLGVFIFGKK